MNESLLFTCPDFCFLLLGESSPTRREAVKRRTAEYLMRAESLSSLCVKPQLDDVSQVCLMFHCAFPFSHFCCFFSLLILFLTRMFENFGLWNFISDFLSFFCFLAEILLEEFWYTHLLFFKNTFEVKIYPWMSSVRKKQNMSLLCCS